MSGLLELFIAPAGERAARPRRVRASEAPGAAPAAVVLGGAGDAAPVARLLAGELRQRSRAACALVGEWRAGHRVPLRAGVATGAARALGERLGGRGLEPVAHGRVVSLALSPEPEVAAGEWARASAAAGCPAIFALAGPRPSALEVWLDAADLVVVVVGAAAPPEIAELALAGLAGISAPVAVSAPVPRGLARVLTTSSLATSRVLGADVAGAVRSLT